MSCAYLMFSRYLKRLRAAFSASPTSGLSLPKGPRTFLKRSWGLFRFAWLLLVFFPLKAFFFSF